MILSSLAFKRTARLTRKILGHPFVLQLIDGSLPWETFSFYLEQDKLYLEDYARCLSVLAKNAPLEYRPILSRYAQDAVSDEQDSVYGYYSQRYTLKKTGSLAPATILYTNSLLRTCLNEPFEVALTSVLPCFWLYHVIGRFAQVRSSAGHRYQHWIDVYASEGFAQSTNRMVRLFDCVGARASNSTQEKMLMAYERSADHELRFFDDSYTKAML